MTACVALAAAARAGQSSLSVGGTKSAHSDLGLKQVTVSPATPENPWLKYYPLARKLIPVKGLTAGDEATEVRDASGNLLGWFFRTDRMAPLVKGYNGQIGALVALDKDGQILGVDVLSQHETPGPFSKLKAPFFAQFRGRRADQAPQDINGVTGATVSSTAVIKDVFQSAATLLKVASPSATPGAPPSPGQRTP
jgi:hypothetical protein